MTNIKSSRKGTRLNDAQYFRLPLPHARKKMMMMRVMPRIADPISDRFQQNANPAKSRDNRRMVESKQSSIEIALVACRGFEDIEQNKERYKDVCVEARVIESSSVSDDSSSSSPQIEDSRQETVRELVRSEEMRGRERCEIIERNSGDRVKTIEEGEKKGGNWWRDGGQTILQFFAKILGKRGGTNTKGVAERVLPGGERRVKRVSRGGRGHNGHRRDVDGGIRLKRVNNGYIVNHVCRNEGSRHGGAPAENKSREEQHYPSILARQIQRTRDKNLRVVLLERELRLRSPKTVRRNTHRLTADGAVRQLSSPLC